MEKISNDSISRGGSPNRIASLRYTSDDQGKVSEFARTREYERERLFSLVCQASAQSWREGIGSA